MLTRKCRVPRSLAPLVLTVGLALAGCAAPLIAFAIGIGKAMVYIAAVKLTVATVDRVLGEKDRDPEAEFVVDPADSNRGTYKRLQFQRANKQNEPIGSSVTLSNVPVYRGVDGKWHIEKYFLEQNVDRAVNDANGR